MKPIKIVIEFAGNGDARCNYCDGSMPCWCERPKDCMTEEEEWEYYLNNVDREW